MNSLTSSPKQPLAVAISVTGDLVFAAAVAMVNFKEKHPGVRAKYILYTDRISKSDSDALQKLGLSVDVVKYKPKLDCVSLWQSRAIAYFSPMVLAKFESLFLATKFDTVLWLDYDIVILKGFSDLLENKDFDISFMNSRHPISTAFQVVPPGLDGTKEGMSAGLLVVHSSFPDAELATSWLYDKFLEHSNDLYFPEQAIFDLYFDNFNPRIRILSPDVYACPPDSEESKIATIIHSYGPIKFWNGRENTYWLGLYEIWCNLGGSRYNKRKSAARKIVRGIKFLIAQGLMRIGMLRK